MLHINLYYEMTGAAQQVLEFRNRACSVKIINDKIFAQLNNHPEVENAVPPLNKP